MSDFCGRFESVHLERGQSFGIAPDIYCSLAQAAISASEVAGIEPQTLEPWDDGRKGAICTLYGKKHCYWIALDCSLEPEQVRLSFAPLDSAETPQEKVAGEVRRYKLWRLIVRELMLLEGFTPQSLWERGYLMT